MTPKIFAQIPKVMADLGAVGKNGNNDLQRYKFRKIDDIYNKLQPALYKNGVFIVPQVLESKEEHFNSAKGTPQIRVKTKIKFMIHAEDGSFVEAIAEGEAIDTSDKATNKAFTAALKYMLIQVFCIAIEDIDDADESSPELPKQKIAAKQIRPTVATTKQDVEALPGEHIAKFGKFKGQKLNTLDIYDLANYVAYIEKSALEKGKPIQGDVAEFMRLATDFLESMAPKHDTDQIPF